MTGQKNDWCPMDVDEAGEWAGGNYMVTTIGITIYIRLL